MFEHSMTHRRLNLTCLIVLAVSTSAIHADMLLSNGGFETGDLTDWMQDAGQTVVVQMSNEMDPSTPRSGQFFISSSAADGADRLGGNEITISQAVDVSSFSFIASGDGEVTATGFFSGAAGVGNSSDDTAQIIVAFFDGGVNGVSLGDVQTTPLDPVVGSWNQVSLGPVPVPSATDTMLFSVRTVLDPGFSSIDIGGDDLSLDLTAVPEPGSAAIAGALAMWLSGRRRRLAAPYPRTAP